MAIDLTKARPMQDAAGAVLRDRSGIALQTVDDTGGTQTLLFSPEMAMKFAAVVLDLVRQCSDGEVASAPEPGETMPVIPAGAVGIAMEAPDAPNATIQIRVGSELVGFAVSRTVLEKTISGFHGQLVRKAPKGRRS